MAEPATFKDLKSILTFAVRREEEAAQAYSEMKELAEDKSLRAVLEELEAEERKHKILLEEVLEGKSRPETPVYVADLRISDYVEDEPLGPSPTIQELLIFAAKKEQKAADLYTALASKSHERQHQKLFGFLASQEKTHKLRLEMEYERYFLAEN